MIVYCRTLEMTYNVFSMTLSFYTTTTFKAVFCGSVAKLQTISTTAIYCAVIPLLLICTIKV